MELIVGGRLSGKTHQLVEAAVTEKLGGGKPVIVVSGVTALLYTRDKVLQELKRRGTPQDRSTIISKEIVQLVGPWLGHSRGTLYIDNLEYVLPNLLGVRHSSIALASGNILVRTPQGKRFEP